MKRILSIEGDVPDLDRSFTAAKKLQEQLKLTWRWKKYHSKILVILQSRCMLQQGKQQLTLILTCREFLGIDKALRSFKGEIVNNLAKLSELDRQLDRDWEKLEEIKDDPSYPEELKDSIRERIDKAESEREDRLEALSINRNKLRSQVSRIKETIAKILDSNTSLRAEKLRTLFREQGIMLAAIFTRNWDDYFNNCCISNWRKWRR